MSEQRAQRVGEAIKAEISDLISKELKDPRIGFASVMRAEVSRDLRHARVFFSVLGDEAQQKETLKGLNSAMGFLRSELSQRIRLRFMPELEFRLDNSIEHGVRIAKLLNEVLPPKREALEATGAEEEPDKE